MTITLSAATTQVIVPQKTKTITTLTVQRMVDLPAQNQVKVFVKELNDPIIVWSGATYDNVGQWTDVDVQAALLSKFQVSGTTV